MSVWSVALGKRLSSSSRASSPSGLARNMSRTGRLSMNSTTSTLMPSAMYSCCSQVKMCWLKKYWICSLAMLMHSCSKLLRGKFSKPKMSRRPTDRGSPLSKQQNRLIMVQLVSKVQGSY